MLFPAGSSADVTARLLADGMCEAARRQRDRGQPSRRRRRDRLPLRRRPEAGRHLAGLELELDLDHVPFRHAGVRLQGVRAGGARAGRVAGGRGQERREVEDAAKTSSPTARRARRRSPSAIPASAATRISRRSRCSGRPASKSSTCRSARRRWCRACSAARSTPSCSFRPRSPQYVKSGQVRFLAALTANRDPAFPDVPTAREQGYDVSLEAWRGIAVPTGTPAADRRRARARDPQHGGEQGVRSGLRTPRCASGVPAVRSVRCG